MNLLNYFVRIYEEKKVYIILLDSLENYIFPT